MLVNISFDDEESIRCVDIVSIPDEIADNLEKVVNEFFRMEVCNTQQNSQPHEHSCHYNENGYRDGVWDGSLTPGYNNLPTQ